MRKMKFKLLIICIIVGCLAAVCSTTVFAKPHFSLLDEEDWGEAELTNIRGMTEPEWDDYMLQFNDPNNLEGEPYPPTTFLEPQLYVYGGGGQYEDYNYPDDAGLVMAWGDPCTMPDGNYVSAWIYEYGEDPDLSNSTVAVQVEPPCGITTISIGLRDINNRIRSWTWNVAAAGVVPPLPPGTLQCSPDAAGIPVRHTIKINLAQTGVTAASPQAASYSNYNSPPNPPPPFNIKQVQVFIYDENANLMAVSNIPPPGQPDPKPWNYWFNLVVTPNPTGGTGAGAFYVKWSQPPVVIDPNDDPPVFNGWDERSDYNSPPIVADDWLCKDDRPVTDIHWWGSFLGWTHQVPPPVMPKRFHIGIWTDVPAGPDPIVNFSHPNDLVWENYCDNWVWNFVGYDKAPDGMPGFDVNDSCFQFTQLLSQDEWFFQKPDPCDPNGRVYWLSIAAIYDPCDPDPKYPWGWKTRPHFFNDDAVRIMLAINPFDGTGWPPKLKIGSRYIDGNPIFWPDPCDTWDMAFELTTKDKAYEDDPIVGDLNADRIVDLRDVASLANNWLVSVP